MIERRPSLLYPPIVPVTKAVWRTFFALFSLLCDVGGFRSPGEFVVVGVGWMVTFEDIKCGGEDACFLVELCI